jgi:hypothetical protein
MMLGRCDQGSALQGRMRFRHGLDLRALPENLASRGFVLYTGLSEEVFMMRVTRRQRLLASARRLPGLAVRCHEGLAESERELLVSALVDEQGGAWVQRETRSPGLKKCRPRRATPLSMQLELFARAVARVR